MNQKFGITRIIEVLRGGNSEKVFEFGFDKLTTYGIMKEYSQKEIHNICDYLIDKEFLLQTTDKYPIIKLTDKSAEILRDRKQILMPYRKDIILYKNKPFKEKFHNTAKLGINDNLLSSLKKLRLELANREKVPAYVIFHDSSLIDMSIRLPSNEKEFLQISGVGKSKMEKYGEKFLNRIREFREANKS
jgi:ATP-dependent DNA helicase RecQ